jgi:glycosyltransferase involved in cell wall biosynthesis
LSIIINATRIGKFGGQRSFGEALVQCFDGRRGVSVIVPAGIKLAANVDQQSVPAWLGSHARISLWRPVLWFAYGAFFFPANSHCRVFTSTHHVLPFRKHQIVIVHDIRSYYHPDSWVQSVYFKFLLPRGLKRCDGILTVSESSKDLIVSAYGIEPERVQVIPNVVDSEFFRRSADRSDNASGYLLTVGSTWPHKNVAELLEMHEVWAARYKVKVVAGSSQYTERLKKIACHLGIQDRVEFLSGISSTELLSLYQHCAALVYPSIMEGFGLPPLEAMSCGRPVLVSDIAPFRELFGEIPIYVELGNAESWRKAFLGLQGYSEQRIQSGIELAMSYSQARMRSSVFAALRAIWGEDFHR